MAFVAAQVAFPPAADASHLGSSTVSAGSAPPPAATAIQSFQPDLFTGRATTSIPIAIPPGRKGLQPSLGLSYSSSSRNGWLGVGWSLDVGYIERSTKRGVPKYDATDTFTFLFQGVNSDLVKIPDGTYRAKEEGAFLRFESKGLSGWEVRDKSGTRYLFGQMAASQVESGGQVFRWCLDKIIDVNGNTLTVTYVKDQGQLYPSRVDYTGHDPTNLPPSNRVEFTLEDRTDSETSYRSGFAITTAKRLKMIEAKATVSAEGGSASGGNGVLSLARRYNLTYTPSARTGRSLLSSMTQVGSDGTSTMPPVTFTYQSATDPSYTLLSNTGLSGSNLWNVIFNAADWSDLNGAVLTPAGVRSLFTTTPTVYTQRSGNFPGFTWNIDGQGNITVSADRDRNLLFWTYVYVASAKTVSVTLNQSEDSQIRFFLNGSTSEVPGWPTKSLSLNQGWNLIELTSYNQNTPFGWTMSGSPAGQVNIMNPTAFIAPQLAGDVDGNATSDLITFDATTNTWSVACALSCTILPSNTWLTGFGNSSSIPLVGDWNGDGRTDIAIYNAGTWRFAKSTGTSFQADALPQLSFGSGTPLIGDFNGDGILDLGTYNTGTWSVALGNGSGFTPASGFTLSWGGGSDQLLTGDFNGDGLTDIGLRLNATGEIRVRLSTGARFAGDTQWLANLSASSPTSADFNGDGLSDLTYFDKSTGKVFYAPSTGNSFGTTTSLPATFSLRSDADHFQVTDVNGDGISDPAVLNSINKATELATSSGTIPDLLVAVANGIGGTTTLTYKPSSQLENTFLPFVTPVVSAATADDGFGNRLTTTYAYRGGLYDGVAKEFRGFARVEVRDPDANVAITEFHQDAQKKGRPFRTEARDASNKLWTKSEQTWSATEPFPGVTFVKLDQTDGFTCDGDDTCKQTRSSLEYDAFGDVTKTREFGDVAVTGDERQTFNEYASNTSAWILGKLAHTKTTNAIDETGRTVAERWFYYDGRLPADPGNPTVDTTPPAKGQLTAELAWWDTDAPADPNPLTRLTYDTFGSVATAIDALGRTTTNTYDPTGTYLTTITNALGHIRTLTYDPRFGQVTSSADQNNVTTTTEYDTLGRVTKVIGPTDTAALPTVRYEYDLSTVPAKTVVHTRIQSGQPEELTAYTFTDGLGRTLQTRSPAEDPTKQIVTGTVQFNNRGLAEKQWVAYLSTASAAYVPLSSEPLGSSLAAVSYLYDPMGRLTKTTDPDGSASQTAYQDWTTTSTDANGNSTIRTNDAYGRLVKVEEHNGTETYTTTYAYDSLGNLLQLTDAKNNVTRMSYDTLGRKVSMDDPDMGRWTYAYDAVNNLLSQTDARGVTTSFTYDPLNRVTRKVYAIPSSSSIANPGTVNYTYDDPTVAFSKGKLTAISDGSGASRFEYDTLGRLTKESKTLDGTTYTIQRAYDLLGRLTALTYPDNDVASYTYNAQGGIETVRLQQGSTTQTIVSDVTYNATGQLVKITYGNGVTTDYRYNPQTLRLDTLKTTAAAGTLQDFSYTFDRVGNVTQIQDRANTASQTFEYDGLHRLTRAVGAYGDVRYAYDAIGNMTSKEGVAMTYGLPNGSKPHAVTGVRSGLGAGGSGFVLNYDANGNVTQKTPSPEPGALSEQIAQQLAYDAEGRLAQVDTAPEETVAVTFKPGWNFFSLPVVPDDLRITSLFPTFSQDFEQIARLAPSLEPGAPSQFQHFSNRLKFDRFTTLDYGVGYQIYCKTTSPVTIAFKGKLPTKKFSKSLAAGWHLLAGIRLQTSDISQVFGGLDTEQILRLDTTTGTLVAAAQVDPAQAYFIKLRTAAVWSPSLPRDPTTRFVYDGDGGRLKQTTSAGTTIFLGQSYDLGPDGTRTKYVFAGSQRIAAVAQSPQPSAPSRRYYHGDHLGSSNVVTDGTGQVVERYEYTPYGSLAFAQSPEPRASSAFKFTGQRLDSSTGLYFYNARYYDPSLGRFISPDPFVQAPADPQLLNRYAYVRNNPLKFTDPSGHFLNFLIGFIIAIAISASVELAIHAFDIKGTTAKALRFIGAIASAGVGGGIGGLTGQALANSIAAAGATSLTLDTGAGRQLTRSVAKQFVEWGMSPRAAAIVGAALTATAVSVAYNVAFSSLTSLSEQSRVVKREIGSEELLNSGRYDKLLGQQAQGQSGGFWGRGSNVTDTARAPNARIFEFSQNGRTVGVLATAPLFGDVPILRHLASALRINHSAFVGYQGTQGIVNSMIPIATIEYSTLGVCHTCTLTAAADAGIPTASVLTAIGPSSAASSLLYGLHGGSTAFYAASTAVADGLD